VFGAQNVCIPASESVPSIAPAGEQAWGRRFLKKKNQNLENKEIHRILITKIKMI
jgi:hypothetical protein